MLNVRINRNSQRKPGAETMRPGRAAFSLLEVVGVLAVLAILAVVIFSATTSSVDTAAERQEAATMQSFADAFQNSVIRTRYIPGTNDWYQTIANELGLTTKDVLFNIRNLSAARVFAVDPSLQLGPGGASNSLPYTQPWNGSIQPLGNCRVMILSSLGKPLPALNGMTSLLFSNIWSTVDGSLPSSGGFTMRPEDLKIQRINLSPLFVRLVITNLTGNVGQFQIDNSQPTNAWTSAYFIQSTVVQLFDELAQFQGREILNRDSGMFYVDHNWRDVPFPPQNIQTNATEASMASTLNAAAILFAASQRNANASTPPPSVISFMTNFMTAYTNYAASGFSNGSPSYNAALTNQTALQNALVDLSTNPRCGP
jgi:type II secretory pathway pseudopilin PulG